MSFSIFTEFKYYKSLELARLRAVFAKRILIEDFGETYISEYSVQRYTELQNFYEEIKQVYMYNTYTDN